MDTGWATIGLTGGLVLITGYYAWQTRRTVDEMKASRAAQIMPHVVPTLGWQGKAPSLAFLRVQNVGPGPAINVRVRLRLDDGNEYSIQWTAGLLTPGEYHDFLPPRTSDGEPMRIQALATKYRMLTLEGTCDDAFKEGHSIQETLDIRELWEATEKAAVRVPPVSVEERLADMSRAMDKIAGFLGSSSQQSQATKGTSDVSET